MGLPLPNLKDDSFRDSPNRIRSALRKTSLLVLLMIANLAFVGWLFAENVRLENEISEIQSSSWEDAFLMKVDIEEELRKAQEQIDEKLEALSSRSDALEWDVRQVSYCLEDIYSALRGTQAGIYSC